MDNGQLANKLRAAADAMSGLQVIGFGRNPMGTEYFEVEVAGQEQTFIIYVINSDEC